MPKTEMPPYKQFAWVQDKYGVSFQLAQEPPTKETEASFVCVISLWERDRIHNEFVVPTRQD